MNTYQGVKKNESYLYSSLHQGMLILPILVLWANTDRTNSVDGIWQVGWGLLLLAAAWTGITVLHTRLRSLALLPASKWDRWCYSEHRRAFLIAWVASSLAASGVAGYFAPYDMFLMIASNGLLGGMLASPALMLGVTRTDDFRLPRFRTGPAVVLGIVFTVIATWAVPTHDPEMLQLRLATTAVSCFVAAFLIGFGAMFINVIATTRALEKARADDARLAVAEERVRFARDLHDVFGRTLSAVALKSELAAAQAERGRPEAATTMREVQSIATDALTEVREVVRGYREADLTSEVAGAKALLEAAGISVTTTQEGSALLPAPVARAFAWTVREAATNVLRHADATSAQILVRADSQLAQLQVRNDRPHPVSQTAGSGLAGLTERLAEVGGTLTWDHQHDSFTLTASVDAAALGNLRRALAKESA